MFTKHVAKVMGNRSRSGGINWRTGLSYVCNPSAFNRCGLGRSSVGYRFLSGSCGRGGGTCNSSMRSWGKSPFDFCT